MTLHDRPLTVRKLNTAEEIVSFLLEGHGRKFYQSDYVFRGEPTLNATAYPMIDRLTDGFSAGAKDQVNIELDVIRRFAEESTMHLTAVEQRLLENGSVLPIMRHYGAPTRLLDWTESPWVGLYFACSSSFDSNGCIRCFRRNALTNCVHDKYKDQTKQLQEIGFIVNTMPPIRIPALLEPDRANTLDRWVVCYHHRGPMFPRLVAQQGLFTLASLPQTDHWNLIKSLVPEGFLEIIVPANQKRSCLAHLRLMGVTAASLFPGITGIAMDAGIHLGERIFPGH